MKDRKKFKKFKKKHSLQNWAICSHNYYKFKTLHDLKSLKHKIFFCYAYTCPHIASFQLPRLIKV